MWLKYAIIFFLFFIFTIIQASFLPYFNIKGSLINLNFILFFILIFFESKNEYKIGFFTVIIDGFFLDLFLPFYFGISIISLLVVYFLEKFTIHFLKEGQDKYPLSYFIPIFSISFIFYNILLYLLLMLFHLSFNLGFNTVISLIYNLFFAVIGFYIYKKIANKNIADNQLKLF